MATRRRAQFNFSRYGKILLLVAMLLGLYLARHAGGCIKDQVSAFQLQSEGVDGASGPVVDDKGRVEASRNHYNESVSRSPGIVTFLWDATGQCVEGNTFREPVPVYYGFWGALGLGLLSLGLARLAPEAWKRDVKRQGRGREEVEDYQKRLRSRPVESLPPGERARITGEQPSLASSSMASGSNPAMRRRPGRSVSGDYDALDPVDALDDVLPSTSLSSGPQLALSSARLSGEFPLMGEDERYRSSPPRGGPGRDARSGDNLSSPGLSTSGGLRGSGPDRPSPLQTDPSLRALGLGSVDDILLDDSNLPQDDPAASGRGASGPGVDVFDFGTIDFGESASLEAGESVPVDLGDDDPFAPGGGEVAGPRVSAPLPPPPNTGAALDEVIHGGFDLGEEEEEDFDLELGDAWEAAEESHGIDFASLLGANQSQPPAGAASQLTPFPSDIGQRARPAPRQTPNHRLHGGTLPPPAASHSQPGPPRVGGARRVFVAPLSDGIKGRGSGANGQDPIFGLAAAIERVRPWAERGEKVEVRVLPGLYREQIALLPNMMLVNDAIPVERSPDALVAWLASNAEDDAAHHAVIALPQHVHDDAFVLDVERADGATVVGLHVAGRMLIDEDADTVLGRGVRVADSRRVTLRLCVLVGHQSRQDGAGLCVTKSGGAERADAVTLEDCLIYQNSTTGRGGGVYANTSVLTLTGCILQDNVAHTAGGGLYLEHTRQATLLTNCRLEANQVACPGDLHPRSQNGWTGEEGHGGGVCLRHGDVHLRGSAVSDNAAQGSGG